MKDNLGDRMKLYEGAEADVKTLSKQMREAGFARRKTWRSLPSDEHDACRRCGGRMSPGIATAQTYSTSDEGTRSPAGPGAVVECSKCEACGWSVSRSAPQ